jgi:seryl-tRNA synthetase
MLTLTQINENKEQVILRLKVKHYDGATIINSIIDLDQNRKATQRKLDENLAEANNLSRQIGNLYKEKKTDEANVLKEKTAALKEESKILSEGMFNLDQEINLLLVEIPNMPHPTVPEGKDESDNLLIRHGGVIPTVPANALPHWDLATKSGIIDFETGNKLTGSGFPVYVGSGARLQRALINFFLDKATENGYLEVEPPLMVNKNTAFGTGQLPDKEGQMYFVELDELYLIPTAEVPLTNMYSDMILETKDLPVKLTGYTPCFRREAGSYGKNVRGLNRVHQFDKVEIVQIQHPNKSYQTLDEMVNYVESLLQLLELPYRILKLCGKDLSFASAMTYDFEVYSAAQQRWLEVSSVSNFESFQSARMKLRFRDEKKNTLLHTLNGSALALPRIVAAILENYQKEGYIEMPKVLVPYTKFERILF